MTTGFYRFAVGSLECVAVSDGEFCYEPPQFPAPSALLFANARQDLVQERLRLDGIRPGQWTRWTSPYICMAVNTDDGWLLVDVGAGDLASTTGRLPFNLAAAGIDAGEVGTVVLTHAHPDHIGGITQADGGLSFPNARYCMCLHEWEFWTCGEVEETLDGDLKPVLLGAVRRNLPPIRGRLELLDRTTEIAPGVTVFPAPGHTPGHMGVSLFSEGEELLCLGDAVLHPIHVGRHGWCAVVDGCPEDVKSTRRTLVGWAANSGALVHAFHFPFPGLGHVRSVGDSWQWERVQPHAV